MRAFLIVWVGQAFSLLGSQLVQFAIVWWLARETGSATSLALASVAALLPQILLGPFAGGLVDRWSRRRVMIAADTVIALATLALAGLFWLDLAATWMIYVFLLVRATGTTFHWPAMQASTTLMVPGRHLTRVAGMNQALSGLATIFVPPLGALALEALPMQNVLAIDVATAIPAVATLVFVTVPQPTRTTAPETAHREPSLWSDMREGLQFVLNWQALMMLAAVGILVHMLGRAAASLTPLFVMQHLGGSTMQLGWWQAAAGIGSVLGGVTLAVWGGFRRKVVTQMLALALDGLAIVAIGLSPQGAFLPALMLIFLVGFLETVAVGMGGPIFQVLVPPEKQGRVFALLTSASQGLAPLGLLLAGPAADAFGVPFWFVLTGLTITAVGASALFVPAIVHIEDRARTT